MPAVITLIIGKNSNLSQKISQKYSECVLISARDIITNIDVLLPYRDENINVIFNNFIPATQLNEAYSSVDYVTQAILVTSMVLDYFQNTTIEKIIYTSSSSVYGNNILCKEGDELKPLNLHAALKVSNEKLVEKYALSRGIDYTITRLFNLYGGEDKFSVISKIIRCIDEKRALTVVNHGNAIRDFIHIDDVVTIYLKLLKIRDLKVVNIGTGMGTSIKNIIDYLQLHGKTMEIVNITRDELKVSTADTTQLSQIANTENFIHIEAYLKQKYNL